MVRLNIGCFPTLSPMYMPKLITNFLNKHNEVDVRLFEGKQKELINGLKKVSMIMFLCIM